MRAMSIIGLVLTVIFLIWLTLAAISNGRIDIEEFAPVAFLYGLYVTVLCVVGMVKGGRKKN